MRSPHIQRCTHLDAVLDRLESIVGPFKLTYYNNNRLVTTSNVKSRDMPSIADYKEMYGNQVPLRDIIQEPTPLHCISPELLHEQVTDGSSGGTVEVLISDDEIIQNAPEEHKNFNNFENWNLQQTPLKSKSRKVSPVSVNENMLENLQPLRSPSSNMPTSGAKRKLVSNDIPHFQNRAQNHNQTHPSNVLPENRRAQPLEVINLTNNPGTNEKTYEINYDPLRPVTDKDVQNVFSNQDLYNTITASIACEAMPRDIRGGRNTVDFIIRQFRCVSGERAAKIYYLFKLAHPLPRFLASKYISFFFSHKYPGRRREYPYSGKKAPEWWPGNINYVDSSHLSSISRCYLLLWVFLCPEHTDSDLKLVYALFVEAYSNLQLSVLKHLHHAALSMR